jgi:hypothetical protein
LKSLFFFIIIFNMNTNNRAIVRFMLVFCLLAGIIVTAHASVGNEDTDLVSPSGNIVLQLTVRVPQQEKRTENSVLLRTETLRFSVNNQIRRILEVTPRTESMASPPEFPGRNFILSVKVSEFDLYIKNALTYFITDVIIPGDTLLLLSPIKAYNIDVVANKTKMIHDVVSLLETDCQYYNKQLLVSLKGLETKTNRLIRLFRGGEDDGANITGFKTVGIFLTTFPQEFIKFRDQFLSPELDKYQKLIELIGNREGQRWWIHFQSGDQLGIVTRVMNVLDKINNYCTQSTLAQKSFSQSLRLLEKLLDLSGSYPAKEMTHLFQAANIRFNALLWNRHQEESATTQAGILKHVVSSIKDVSLHTGGITIHTPNLEKGLETIVHHRDRFYLLSFYFDGNLGDKKLNLATHGTHHNFSLSYLHLLPKDILYQRVRFALTDKISISGFKLAPSKKKPRIKFSLNAVTFDKRKKFGLVKVRVALTTTSGDTVFQSQNTLRTSKKKVSVSIPLNPDCSGNLKLKILAFDLIANRMTSFEEDITL